MMTEAALQKSGTKRIDPAGGEMRQYATFRVAELFMGFELAKIQELMRWQEMASVPLAPVAVEGLINLRGQIVTALDMRRILGVRGHRDPEIPPMNIVLHSEGGTVSLLVDEICDVLDIPLFTAVRPPENLPAHQRALLNAVYQLDSGLLLVLNTERILTQGADEMR